MKICKKHLIAILGLLAVLPVLAVTGDAGGLLRELRERMSAPSVEALFTIDGFDGPVQGSATLSGSKLAMTTPQMCIWYDGTIQWTYLTGSRELNISEPDATDLLATNPFAILTSDGSEYRSKRLDDKGGKARIELLPTDTSTGISRIVVSMNRSTKWPTDIDITFSDDRKVSLKVDKISAGTARPLSVFRYNKAAYPASEIIDLR